jgi:glyoxylase-like metal-dependent hydrolase (beta-lactamase superfamily II)
MSPLVTLDQVDALADWVRGFGKRITGVYITHGHSDHWIGLARLQEHFPEARGMATREVVGRATFEATDTGLSAYWKASFPGELPETAALPEALTADEFELEGHALRAVSVGQGGSVEDIVNAMLKLHGDRDNPRTLWHSARTAVAKRG